MQFLQPQSTPSTLSPPTPPPPLLTGNLMFRFEGKVKVKPSSSLWRIPRFLESSPKPHWRIRDPNLVSWESQEDLWTPQRLWWSASNRRNTKLLLSADSQQNPDRLSTEIPNDHFYFDIFVKNFNFFSPSNHRRASEFCFRRRVRHCKCLAFENSFEFHQPEKNAANLGKFPDLTLNKIFW